MRRRRQQRLDDNKQTLKDSSRSWLITTLQYGRSKSLLKIMSNTYQETLVTLIGVHLHTEVKYSHSELL